MARNQVRRPAVAPESPKPGPLPVVVALLAIGIVGAAGIVWMAPAREVDALPATASSGLPPAQDAATAPDGTPAAPSVAAGSPSFLDPAAAGTLAYEAGDYEGALAHYQAAIARNPDDAESHSNLGQMLVRLNLTEEALPHFDRAIEILPQRWAYHFNRARALSLLQRWDESLAGYRQAQQLFPDNYATAFNLAQTLHKKGDEAAAVEQYLRAIELNPSDPSFQLALGISYERLGKRGEAAAAYGAYLRAMPDAPDAAQVRERVALLTGAS